jgi:L-lactate dehydrogenase complex protein LldG
MQDSTTSREKILKQIRTALINPSSVEMKDVDNESDIFTRSDEPIEIQFAQNFSEINGMFVFCESENEFIENIALIVRENKWDNIFCVEPLIKEFLRQATIPFSDNENDLLNTNMALTFCECLVARTGSIVISSKQASGRRLAVFPNIHVVVAYTSQLVHDVKDALRFIQKKYPHQLPSMITTISGPSRTADIEKTLVQGAHGPKEIFLFLIDDTAVEE